MVIFFYYICTKMKDFNIDYLIDGLYYELISLTYKFDDLLYLKNFQDLKNEINDFSNYDVTVYYEKYFWF